ncbi:hypothetical protein HG535_0C05320 [Zygotorulaspora mrakii]|uniref:DOD-type homing endonuclease domain-containing protein n=1 Tax=Zygotorulaspora mrakii TaxID=42260 RepID=A0A7H9B0L7_ZYGMR|nr:uncharacterized protein HG535_0C05320 [Zygotorulaspora mrakii]QLG72178.1 hypothetical protein HG535_0C05320 [Zygotorulaspora mrakii]
MNSRELALTGGLTKGTKIFDADGILVPVEEMKAGTHVMSDDGSLSKVIAVHRSTGDVVNLTQDTFQYAHLLNEDRDPPWGLVQLKCSKLQRLQFRTFQKIKKYTKHSLKKIIVEAFQLCDQTIENGKVVKMVKMTSKRFSVDDEPTTIQNYIDSVKVECGFIDWECELDNLKFLSKDCRTATRVLLSPLPLEKSVLQPWLETHFNRKVSLKQLKAMAWLLGFWIGDGYRRGAMFTLHLADRDVNRNLQRNAELWGMKLRIAPRCSGNKFKADGYLHTFDGAVRNWNAHNPLTEVLEGLEFYENGYKNNRKKIPTFMRLEQRVVRETFMAGLIDADASVIVKNHTIRVKLPTVHESIRNGIFWITRSLGLNISIYFHHSRNSPNGDRKNDSWIFHILGGTNLEVLFSILSKCSSEKNKTPLIEYISAQHRRIDGDDHFGLSDNDSNDFSESKDEERDNSNVQHSAAIFSSGAISCLDGSDEEAQTEELEVEEVGIDEEEEEEEEEEGEEEEEEAEKGAEVLHPAMIRFSISSTDREEIYGLVLSADSRQTLVTDNYVICSYTGISTNVNMPNANFERLCFSCHKDTKDQWYRIPWDNTNPERVCSTCYSNYFESKTRCSDCSTIYGKVSMRQKVRSENKKSHTLSGGTSVEGYGCDKCDGIIIQFEEPNKKVNKRDEHRKGVCHFCSSKESGCWRKVPWEDGSEWCSVCRSRYHSTATICTNEACRKIPFKAEFDRMEVIEAKEGRYKCLKCGSIAQKNLEKQCRVLKQLVKRRGNCYSCGKTNSNKWTRLPWDKNAAGEICCHCYHLLRTHKGRCLNPECRKIFSKAEMIKIRKLRSISGPSPGCPQCRPCIKCKGMTTII